MDIANRIERARNALGVSQEQAAKKWGVSLRTLQNWEQGVNAPRGLGLVALRQMIAQETGAH